MGHRGFDWRDFVRRPQAVLAAWLVWCAVRLALQPLFGWDPVGPDDWTRLLEVRSLLDGQAFWDVTQYRMNPPEGFSMHWSRQVDLPIAALALLLGGGLFWPPFATAIMGGTALVTLLSFYLVPCAFSLMTRRKPFEVGLLAPATA